MSDEKIVERLLDIIDKLMDENKALRNQLFWKHPTITWTNTGNQPPTTYPAISPTYSPGPVKCSNDN